jgi:hypothetical protein
MNIENQVKQHYEGKAKTKMTAPKSYTL